MWFPSCNVELENTSKDCFNCKADFSNPLGWKMIEKASSKPPSIRPTKVIRSSVDTNSVTDLAKKKKKTPRTLGDFLVQLVGYTISNILLFGILFVSCYSPVRG
jgi:hypothetical protein